MSFVTLKILVEIYQWQQNNPTYGFKYNKAKFR